MTLSPEELERLVRLEAGTADLHADVHEIKADVKTLDQKLDTLTTAWNNRPSWLVSLVIGALMSSTSALAVIVIAGR